MKLRLINTLLFLVMGAIVQGNYRQQSFDRNAYYNVMASGNMEVVNDELSSLEKSSFQNRDAFLGTLMMKKSGLLTKAKEKLDLFKSGRSKLEAVIKTDGNNGELRFLRLMIQEQAPKVVNYRNDLPADSRFIDSCFKSLSPVVQQAIMNYSKKSKILHPKDF